jgi:hypothetical protein
MAAGGDGLRRPEERAITQPRPDGYRLHLMLPSRVMIQVPVRRIGLCLLKDPSIRGKKKGLWTLCETPKAFCKGLWETRSVFQGGCGKPAGFPKRPVGTRQPPAGPSASIVHVFPRRGYGHTIVAYPQILLKNSAPWESVSSYQSQFSVIRSSE